MTERDIDGEIVRYSPKVAHQLIDDISQAHGDFSATAAEALRLLDACLLEESELIPFAETPLHQFRQAIARAFQTMTDAYTQDLIPNVAEAIAYFDETERRLAELAFPDVPLHPDGSE